MSYEKSLLLNAAVYSQLRIGLFSFENGMYLVILVLKSPAQRENFSCLKWWEKSCDRIPCFLVSREKMRCLIINGLWKMVETLVCFSNAALQKSNPIYLKWFLAIKYLKCNVYSLTIIQENKTVRIWHPFIMYRPAVR